MQLKRDFYNYIDSAVYAGRSGGDGVRDSVWCLISFNSMEMKIVEVFVTVYSIFLVGLLFLFFICMILSLISITNFARCF